MHNIQEYQEAQRKRILDSYQTSSDTIQKGEDTLEKGKKDKVITYKKGSIFKDEEMKKSYLEKMKGMRKGKKVSKADVDQLTKSFAVLGIGPDGEELSEEEIEKARSGTYVDNARNRKLGRVGQAYGSKGKKEEEKPESSQEEPEEEEEEEMEEGSVSERAELVDISEEMATDLEDLAGAEIENSYDGDSRGKIVEMSDGSEYLVYDDYDEMEQAAIDNMKDMLDSEPESFVSEELFEQFGEINKYDISFIADDEVEAMHDNFVEQAEEEAEEDDSIDVDDRVEELREEYHQEITDALEEDAIGYFKDRYGYTMEQIMENPSFNFDSQEAAEYIVRTDGPGHSLGTYDGYEHDIGGGHAIRTN